MVGISEALSTLSFGSSTFDQIDWKSFKNRPNIDPSNICREDQWWEQVPCCMSGYSIEHVIDTGRDSGFASSAEMRFLESYPCLNGVELDGFFEKFSAGEPVKESGELAGSGLSEAEQQGFFDRVFGTIKEWFGEWF